ncbi:MAG: MFS transporter [Vulcanimicrobiota bacterium]
MVLRNRDFALLWCGQLVSQLGNQFNYIALAWLVLTTTGSSVAMSGVFLAQVLPNALFGCFAGVVVDRCDRRRLMLFTDWLRAGLVLALPGLVLYGALPLAAIYGVTFLVSSLSLLFYASEKSMLPNLVSSDELTEANAYSEMTAQAAGLVGPVLAGLLVAVLPSPVYVLFLDGASFAVSALTLLAMRWRDARRPTERLRVSQWLSEGLAGIRYLVRGRFLRIVFLTATAVNFLVMPFAVVFPVYAREVLLAGAPGFGWLMGGIGAGMLLGSLAAGWLARRLEPAVIVYAGMALLGVSFALMAHVDHLGPAILLAAVAGFGVSPGNAVILTMVQRTTPEEMQGRVFSSLFAVVGMAAPLGVGLAGPLLGVVGPATLLGWIGGLTLLAAGWGYLLLAEEPISLAGCEPE